MSGTCQFPAKSWLIAVEERLDGSLPFVIHKNLEDGQEITHRLFVETGPSLLDVDSLVGLLRIHSAELQGRTRLLRGAWAKTQEPVFKGGEKMKRISQW